MNVFGHLTVNGAIPTYDTTWCAPAYKATDPIVSLYFEQVSTGAKFESAVRCNHNGFNYALRLPPGTYNVYAGPGYSNDANVVMSPFKLRVASNLSITADVADLKLKAGTFSVETKDAYAASESNFVPGRFPDLTVSGNVTNLLLDRTVRTVSGRLTVNDLPPTVDASYCSNPDNAMSCLRAPMTSGWRRWPRARG